MLRVLKERARIHSVALYPISFSNIVWEERVLLNCIYCHNYNRKCTCPPKLTHLNFQKALSEYDQHVLVVYKHLLGSEISQQERQEASRQLHKYLRVAEDILWQNNHPLALTFIGGSCRACAVCDGSQHSKGSRIPVEAMGINVVATAKSVGITLVFPPTSCFYRIGMIVW